MKKKDITYHLTSSNDIMATELSLDTVQKQFFHRFPAWVGILNILVIESEWHRSDDINCPVL